MTQRLTTTAPDFAAAFTDLVDARREADEDVSRDVTAILKAVRANGDAALADYTQRFDHHDLNVTGWAVTATETRAALDTLSTPLRDALELAAARITAYHEKQKPVDSDGVDSAGVRLGARWSAVDAAGLYVPGGRAAYPSSLLMNVIPAKVAGVQRIAMVTPTPNGEINPLVLAAAQIAGIEEIWRVGGAQAVAALAYGTDRIAPVDVITGPGNAWVAEAKRQLYGVVGIDMVAGPSEIVVVADGRNNPDWIAADLLSQSEHDPTSQSILFTDDAAFADAVDRAVDGRLGQLATEKVARASWAANGAIIVVRDFEEAMPLVNRLAAEHLELAVDDPDALFAKVRHAGSVFLGEYTSKSAGDYATGANHVLPTGGMAKNYPPLGVEAFGKWMQVQKCSRKGLSGIRETIRILAEYEGLPAHDVSADIRFK